MKLKSFNTSKGVIRVNSYLTEFQITVLDHNPLRNCDIYTCQDSNTGEIVEISSYSHNVLNLNKGDVIKGKLPMFYNKGAKRFITDSIDYHTDHYYEVIFKGSETFEYTMSLPQSSPATEPEHYCITTMRKAIDICDESILIQINSIIEQLISDSEDDEYEDDQDNTDELEDELDEGSADEFYECDVEKQF